MFNSPENTKHFLATLDKNYKEFLLCTLTLILIIINYTTYYYFKYELLAEWMLIVVVILSLIILYKSYFKIPLQYSPPPQGVVLSWQQYSTLSLAFFTINTIIAIIIACMSPLITTINVVANLKYHSEHFSLQRKIVIPILGSVPVIFYSYFFWVFIKKLAT